MAQWTGAIAADGDDGYQQYAGWSAGSPVYFGVDGSADTYGGVRFVNVTVPAGATITSAELTVMAVATVNPTTGFTTQWHGDDVDDAAAFSSSSLPSGITETSAKVDFDPAEWAANTNYNIDVTTIVSEILGRAGWASGNDLRLVVHNDGGTVLARFYARETSTTDCARLTINYTEAASSILPLAAQGMHNTQRLDTMRG